MAEQTSAGAANLRSVAGRSSGRSIAPSVSRKMGRSSKSDGRDAPALRAERPLPLRGGFESLGDLRPQPVARHDGIDHLLRRQLVDVDVRLVLLAQLLDVGRPLALRLLLDLVEVD